MVGTFDVLVAEDLLQRSHDKHFFSLVGGAYHHLPTTCSSSSSLGDRQLPAKTARWWCYQRKVGIPDVAKSFPASNPRHMIVLLFYLFATPATRISLSTQPHYDLGHRMGRILSAKSTGKGYKIVLFRLHHCIFAEMTEV